MKNQLLLAMSLAVASFTAVAQDAPSYTYVEAGYSHTDIDDLGDGDGYALSASFGFADSFHVFGTYSAEQNDEFGLDIDLDSYRVGAGHHYTFGKTATLETNLFYENVNFSVDDGFSSGEAEVDGFGAEVGVRGKLAPRLEGWAFVGYVNANDGTVSFDDGSEADLESSDGSAFGRVGGQFNFNQTWGIVGAVRFDADVTRSFVGVRASF